MSHSRARFRHSTGRGDAAPALDLSSLVDISFLLLIYFLVTSTLDPKEADLGANLSIPKEGSVSSADPITVEISREGIVSSEGEIYGVDPAIRELPQLRERLKSAVEARELSIRAMEPQKVLVDADDNAQGQRFIDVMNCLSEAGITDVVLAGFVE